MRAKDDNLSEGTRMAVSPHSADYLTPFLEVGCALCEGADSGSVMNLIVQKITKTLDLKGCFIKMKNPQGDYLELLASCGLSESFLFSGLDDTSDSICFNLPAKTICVSRLEEVEIKRDRDFMMTEGVSALAVLPVEVERQVVAMMMLFAGAPREFSSTELGFARSLAAQGILSIESKRRVEALVEHERTYLRSFQELSSAINSSLDIGKVLELVVTKVTDVLAVKGCVVRLLDPKTKNLYLARGYGLSREFLDKGPVDAQASMGEDMAGQIVVIEDVFSDPRLQYPAETAKEGVRKILSVPLEVRGKIIGVLRIYTAERPPFTKREINFARAIAGQSAFAIENARIYERLRHEYQHLLMDFGYEGSSN